MIQSFHAVQAEVYEENPPNEDVVGKGKPLKGLKYSLTHDL